MRTIEAISQVETVSFLCFLTRKMRPLCEPPQVDYSWSIRESAMQQIPEKEETYEYKKYRSRQRSKHSSTGFTIPLHGKYCAAREGVSRGPSTTAASLPATPQ